MGLSRFVGNFLFVDMSNSCQICFVFACVCTLHLSCYLFMWFSVFGVVCSSGRFFLLFDLVSFQPIILIGSGKFLLDVLLISVNKSLSILVYFFVKYIVLSFCISIYTCNFVCFPNIHFSWNKCFLQFYESFYIWFQFMCIFGSFFYLYENVLT